MANTFKLKRSAVQGKVPQTTDLDLGEIAINTYDGQLYIKRDQSGSEAVVPVGNVGGPGSSTDNAVVRFDGTTGKLVQDSTVSITDTGAVLVGNGTAAAPGFAFALDRQMGLFRSNTGLLGFATSGITRMILGSYTIYLGNNTISSTPANGTLTATGGLGTNIAGANLTIQGGSSTGNAAGGAVIFQTAAAGSSGSSANTLTERLRITSTGTVGIGETSPGSRLQVNTGNAATKGLILKAAASQTANLFEAQDSSGVVLATMTSAGDVGIGTASPQAKLHVQGALRLTDGTFTREITGQWFQSSSSRALADVGNQVGLRGFNTRVSSTNAVGSFSVFSDGANGGILYATVTDDAINNNGSSSSFPAWSASRTRHDFYTSGTNRMAILSDGSVMVGTTTAQTGSTFVFDGGSSNRSLRVRGDTVATILLEDKGVADASKPFQYLHSDGGALIFGNADRNGTGTSGSTERMRITSAGNVGIGTASPARLLDVNGFSRFRDIIYLASDERARISWNSTDLLIRSEATYGISFQAAASERMRITPTGDVGIGENSPGSRLHVNTGAVATKGLILKAAASQTASLFEAQDSSGNVQLALASNGRDLALDATTGTKIGTATTQKLGLWNTAPIVQPTTSIAEAAFVENAGGTAVNDDSTFGGYTIRQVVQALKDLGVLA